MLALASLVLLSPVPQGVQVERFSTNPLLSVHNVDRSTAQNLDRPSDEPLTISFAGPSVIRIPDWLELPAEFDGAVYLMYFAHHKGGHIRLAHAANVRGPWTMFAEGAGVFGLKDVEGVIVDHVASPDVHVDSRTRELVMYFHGPRDGADFDQRSFLATSRDGVRFELNSSERLGPPYFRVAWWRGHAYSPSRLGPLLRSPDGSTAFERGPDLFAAQTRHYATVSWNDRLYFFYSRRGGQPERIRLRTIDAFDDSASRPMDWSDWVLSPAVDVLRPETGYELDPGPRVLDPCVFFDADGECYLFYSAGHERSIAGARLILEDWQTLGVRNVRCLSGARVGARAMGAAVGARPWLGSVAALRSLPTELTGATLVETAAKDARSPEDATHFLRFEVSHAATVTVGIDDVLTRAPEWLDPWTATGGTLVVEDPRGPNAPPRTLRIFERDVEPGEVALGGNLPRDAPFPDAPANYVVFARER